MRVLVTGAYGLIGAACLARLKRDGHELTAAGRSIADASRKYPFARWVFADFDRLTEAVAWRPLLDNIDAVVNCVGVLQDGARDDTRRVHVAATCALFDACAAAGARRVIQISAIGAASDGPTEFARTKAEADAHLATLDLDWLILRPALVLSSTAFGGTAMLRGIAAMPSIVPVIGAGQRIQVVSVEDLAETVARAVRAEMPVRATWDVSHPQVHTLGEIVKAIRNWLGFPPRPLFSVPPAVGNAVAVAADALGWLGWRSPARSTAMAQLGAGVVGDPSAWMAATGIRPQGLDDILAAHPAGVQERWFAKTYLLKPVAIAALALFWIVTGLISLGPGRAAALADFRDAGASPAFANASLTLGALADIALGLLLLARRTARVALIGMIAVSVAYLVIGTVMAPELWRDPLGPLTKIVPVLLATAFTLAILDER